MRTTLQNFIDETVEEILANQREDGLDLPIQAERAAKQIFDKWFIDSPSALERLYAETIDMQAERSVVASWLKFASTSTTNFIAEAAKQQMGGEYAYLLRSRTEALAPGSSDAFG